MRDNVLQKNTAMAEATSDSARVPPYSGMFSAIVPCRDEREALPIFYAEFMRAMDSAGAENFEIIFVEDGSKDGTLEYLRELAAKDSRVKYISLSRNFGKEAAMYAGLRAARGDIAAIMDADLQDPPSLLPQMFMEMRVGGYDSVATRRRTRRGESPVRSFCARAFYRVLNSLSSLKFVEGARDFRLINRRVIDSVLEMPEYNRFIKGMYEWVGFKTKWIEFDNVERCAGKTKWSFAGLAAYSLDALTSFSTIPLGVAAAVGIFFCLFSSVAIVLLSIRQLMYHNSAYGWTSMICVIFFLSGMQLFCLGVLGHYMSKLYLESKRRPAYIIREKN